jgi:predicted DNA-binding ribbon-helix-helix protein
MKGPAMKSAVVKRSVVIAGHKTSVSLEDPFWKALREIATSRDMTLSDLVTSIDTGREHANLSSALRLFILGYYHIRINEERPTNNPGSDEMAVRAERSA